MEDPLVKPGEVLVLSGDGKVRLQFVCTKHFRHVCRHADIDSPRPHMNDVHTAVYDLLA